MKSDALERIADALDGGGDFGQGTPAEVSYLNRIANVLESGGGNSGSVAICGSELDMQTFTLTLTETWQTICDLMRNGTLVFVHSVTESGVGIAISLFPATSCVYNGEAYAVTVMTTTTIDDLESYVAMTMTTDSADGYPSYSMA